MPTRPVIVSYELYGFDGFRWEFICDGETREQMMIIAASEGVCDSYEQTRIKMRLYAA